MHLGLNWKLSTQPQPQAAATETAPNNQMSTRRKPPRPIAPQQCHVTPCPLQLPVIRHWQQQYGLQIKIELLKNHSARQNIFYASLVLGVTWTIANLSARGRASTKAMNVGGWRCAVSPEERENMLRLPSQRSTSGQLSSAFYHAPIFRQHKSVFWHKFVIDVQWGAACSGAWRSTRSFHVAISGAYLKLSRLQT